MEGVEKKIRDSISDYLLQSDICDADPEIFSWLRLTPSQVGDFSCDVHAELVKKSLSLKNGYFKIALIDFLLLDIGNIKSELVDAYFEALNSVDQETLDLDITSQSISIMFERKAINGETLSRELSRLNFEFSSRLLCVLQSSYSIQVGDVSLDLANSAKSDKRLLFRAGIFWHFLFIVKPLLLKFFPVSKAYKNVHSAINDWPYSYDGSADLLVECNALNPEEKSLFEEFGAKLHKLMEKKDYDGLRNSHEYDALCKEYYQKIFQGKDVFEKIYGA